MSGSQLKAAILARHVNNELLLAPTLMPVAAEPNDLSADQPTMQPAAAIIEFVTDALKAGQTHYVDVPGIPSLRQALAEFLQSTGLNGVDVSNVLVTAGMQETRFLSIQQLGRLLGPVALPDVVHPGARKALGIRPLVSAAQLPTDPAAGFLPTLDGIRAALEDGARVLFLESPVRLTGKAFPREAVAAIARLAVQFQAAVIWDQGLAPWVESYTSVWNEPGMNSLAVVLGEAFPGVGIEAWYIGYVATANKEWWEKIRRDKQAICICTSTADQLAAIKAADLYGSLHVAQRARLAVLRQQAVAKLKNRVVPGDAVSVVAVKLPDVLALPPLRKGGFDLADGTDFGACGVIRLAVTEGNQIAEAIELLR